MNSESFSLVPPTAGVAAWERWEQAAAVKWRGFRRGYKYRRPPPAKPQKPLRILHSFLSLTDSFLGRLAMAGLELS